MNEADTRAELIEPQLLAAGWAASVDVKVKREHFINDGEIRAGGTRGRQLKADYVLIYKNIKLAVVEAKSDELQVNEGVAQAKLYAQKLDVQTSFAANGKQIYQICHKTGKEELIEQFPTPEELWQKNFANINEWQEKFNEVAWESTNKKPRYYQEVAVNRVMGAIAADQKRILLTLATGTGKTYIAFQIAWKLFNSHWTIHKNGNRPRILFLSHRNILTDQASSSFDKFQDATVRITPDEIKKHGEVPTNANVFFTIFQTFMSGGTLKSYKEYDRDFFDLVIIDECHVGGANNDSEWRDILDYFNAAVHLGLTATPKRDNNVDTYEYFGEPVYTYSLKEGIMDGFLTPFKVRSFQTTLDEYVYNPDDEVEEGVVEEGKVYTEDEMNTKISILARERYCVKLLLGSINQNEKTLVFCANQEHAAKVRDLINQESESTSVDYCVRVTSNDGNLGETYLSQFQDNETVIPTILTTSRKLTVGVDARNVRNIVLMRPTNNMIEFKQIIGRGTRLFYGKYYFTIIDFFGACSKFEDPEWDGLPIAPEGPPPGDKPKNDEAKDNNDDGKKKKMVRIRLSEDNEREIEHTTAIKFFYKGDQISAEEFLRRVFDLLLSPEFLGNEQKLQEIWANPNTRRELLARLEENGCTKDNLAEFQKVINAENSDLFDVLEYIAYHTPPVSREQRVKMAEKNIESNLDLTPEQCDFIEFVCGNYMREGMDELDINNLSTVLNAKYGSVHEGMKILGDVAQIQNMCIDFQQILYAAKKEDA